MKYDLLKLKTVLLKNERILLPVFLLLGFAIDSITLRRVDLLPETILVYAYLLLSGIAIFLMHLHESGHLKGQLADQTAPFFPLVMTYAFGSLFSAFVVFYTKSALISDSWPFIAALILVVVGLEVFKEYRSRLVFSLSIFYLALFSFSVFSVPLWVGELGTKIFFLSMLVTSGMFAVFCFLLFIFGKKLFISNLRAIASSVGALSLVMVLLYATNTLPPIPLVLRDIGVFHSVARDGNSYQRIGEEYTFVERLFGITLHWIRNEPVYVYSSVFTPVAIDTDIVHRWEFWSDVKQAWVLSTIVSYPAEGGREEGYRGFSFKQQVFPGRWRVTVETPNELKIGRIEFTVKEVTELPPLSRSSR